MDLLIAPPDRTTAARQGYPLAGVRCGSVWGRALRPIGLLAAAAGDDSPWRASPTGPVQPGAQDEIAEQRVSLHLASQGVVMRFALVCAAALVAAPALADELV